MKYLDVYNLDVYNIVGLHTFLIIVISVQELHA